MLLDSYITNIIFSKPKKAKKDDAESEKISLDETGGEEKENENDGNDVDFEEDNLGEDDVNSRGVKRKLSSENETGALDASKKKKASVEREEETASFCDPVVVSITTGKPLMLCSV